MTITAFKNRFGHKSLPIAWLAAAGLLLFGVSQAQAAINRVQDIGSASLAAAGATTFSIPVTAQVAAGDVVTVEVVYSGSTNLLTPPLPTDSGGNIYAVRGGAQEVFGDTLQTVDYIASVTTSLQPGDTITIRTGTAPNDYNVVAAAQEYSGVSTDMDNFAIGVANPGGTTANFQTGNLVTANADDLLYGYVAVQSTNVSGIVQTTSPALVPEAAIQAQGISLYPLYAIVSQIGSYSLGGSLSTTSTPPFDVTIRSLKASTAVAAANLVLSKSHVGNFVQGQTGAVYTLNVANVGSAASSGVVTVTDTLPAGMSFVSGTGANWSCSLAASQTVSCTSAATIDAGQSATLHINVNVDANAPAQLTNQAVVSCASPCGSSGNPASDPTTIAARSVAPTSTPAPMLDWIGLMLLAALLAMAARRKSKRAQSIG